MLRASSRLNWNNKDQLRDFSVWGDIPHDFVFEEEVRSVAECIQNILYDASQKTISISQDGLAVLESVALASDNSFPIYLHFSAWAPQAQPDIPASGDLANDLLNDVWKRSVNAVIRNNPLDTLWRSQKPEFSTIESFPGSGDCRLWGLSRTRDGHMGSMAALLVRPVVN
ncbi:hypothetical protein DTO271G3_8203 [Paecilomyces variotii]|nr:hypothetical protein DTO271G3_8203 [Paecilomyces variotii]